MNQKFKRDDRVQVRNQKDEKWQDAFYVAYVPDVQYPHVVLRMDEIIAVMSFKICRAWPIVTDEEVAMLTDIEPTESTETKLDNAIAVMNGAIAHLNAEINKLKNSIK